MNLRTRVLIALIFLEGCANTRWTPPDIDVPPHWSTPAENTAAISPQLSEAWWTHFNDLHLTALIDEALAANNDLAAATIRVQRARLQAGLANTTLTPDVSVSAGLKTARDLNTRDATRSANVNGSLSYELDIGGKQAHRRAAAAWEAQATEADREQTMLNLIGTAAELYWKLAYFNEQSTDREAAVQDVQKILDVIKARTAAGAVSGLELVQAEQNVSNQRLAQTQLRQQRVETRHAIAVLLNRPPQYPIDVPERLPDTPLPAVEADLPADVLKRQPELKAAELRLRASFAQIGEARASFYPSFTLTGSLGSASDALLRVLQNPVATLGIGLTLPFIQWNTLHLKLKVSQNEYQEAVVYFRQKLYQALAEVENALSARAQLISEAAQQAQIVMQSARAEAIARARFNAGATGIKPWLEEQHALRSARDAQRKTRLQQLNNRMKLYQVFGGR